MSKISRAIQSTAAKTSWTDMAKILFSADDNLNRRQEAGKLISSRNRSIRKQDTSPSYSTEQLQYMLLLMLILTSAEKRTQEMYEESFASRCDAISKEYGLNDDQYWTDGSVPAAWAKLDAEFEQRSLEILVKTLREYHLYELADQVQAEGSEQLLDIIHNIESHFLNVLQHPNAKGLKANPAKGGSLPETLSFRSSRK